MEDAAAGGHPLRVALADHAAAAVRVVVDDLAVEHVGHGLEAAVRVPGRADGFAGPVHRRAHLVEQQERVGVVEAQPAGERPPDLEAGALGHVAAPARPTRPGAGGRPSGRAGRSGAARAGRRWSRRARGPPERVGRPRGRGRGWSAGDGAAGAAPAPGRGAAAAPSPGGSGGLLDRRHVELEGHLVGDQEPAGLEGDVPRQPPVLAVQLDPALEARAEVAERVAWPRRCARSRCSRGGSRPLIVRSPVSR